MLSDNIPQIKSRTFTVSLFSLETGDQHNVYDLQKTGNQN